MLKPPSLWRLGLKQCTNCTIRLGLTVMGRINLARETYLIETSLELSEHALICQRDGNGNPGFIPEMSKDVTVAGQIFRN